MLTPSHLLTTAALDKAMPRVTIHRQAFLLGSVAPDLPLWILSLGGIIYYHFILGWSMAATSQLMFADLYFHNPFWLALHNLLHAPILLVLGIALIWKRRRNIGSVDRWLFCFLLACLFHSAVDMFTHADDGPLLLFPLNWSIRFHSPVSYWDPKYYGREFSQFEMALNGLFVIYLLKARICRFLRHLKLPVLKWLV
ncbi:MAG: zinc dependent phospholipase C family protein [Leptolyngbyaceae cyanobacterium bins.302]|nr:zinc dependent phospholipase C family protein [Leptolyngbyaceae cyanobacterium bins.302]